MATRTNNNGAMDMTPTEKALEAIEMANNAYLISNAYGVITFAATKFAAQGIARHGFAPKLIKEGFFDGRNEPEPHVFNIVID